MHKLDDFFKNSLEDVNEAPDGWNVPTELPWEAAEPHFPKPKSKRRIWPFLLFVGLLISAGLAWMNWDGKAQTQEQTQAQPETQVQAQVETQVQEQEEGQGQTEEAINNFNSNDNTLTENELVKTNRSNKSSAPVTKTEPTEKVITNSRKIKDTKISLASFSTPEPVELNRPILSKDEEKAELLNNENATLEVSQSTVGKSLVESTAPIIGHQLSLSVLPVSTIDEIDFNYSNQLPLLVLPKVEPLTNIKNTREDYSNINLKYTKWIGKRWRMSTGLYYSNLKIDLDVVGFFEFDRNMISESTTAEYETVVKRFSVDESNDLSIAFLPGLAPEIGDILNLRGNLELGLSSIQVPILFEYNFERPKMEYSIGGGLLLGYWTVAQSSIDLDLYKDDLVIAEKPVIEDVGAHNIELSAFMQLGFRRKITSKFNIGLNIKYDLVSPIFSGFEVGAYYRFTK